MTVPVAARKAGPYTGNGVATSFAFSFKTFAKADLLLVRTVIATGIESTLVLDSDYSVALNATQDVTPGGTITYPLVGSPLASTHKLTIASNLEIKQPLDITNLGGFFPQTQEDAFDRAVMLIGQLEVDIARSVKVPLSSSVDPDDLIDQLTTDVAGAAAAAAASAASATASSGSATASAGSATAAAASAASAQTIVDSVGFRDVLFKTFADSPITVTQAMSGKLLSIDTSGGNVAVTMPQISALSLPYTVGVKKTTGDANTVTCTRAGTDLFDDGSTTLTFGTVGGAVLIPDVDSAPDKWSVASFGAAVGQQIKQQFVAGVGFTAGVSTTVTLTESPISTSKDALEVFQDGVYQQESEWSYAPGTGIITFTSVIGASVAKIEAKWVTPLAIGTPADGTVTPMKLSAAGSLAAHATTMNPWGYHVAVLTGSVVTFTDVADANYVGQVVWLKMNAAHIWTNGANFAVQGSANYTTAAGDWVRLHAITTSTFGVTILPLSGMPTQQARFKTGGFTFDTAAASGTTAVTGIGFTPKLVRLRAVIVGGARMSVGADDGTSANCIYADDNTSSDTWGANGSESIYIISAVGTTSTAHVSSFDADGFTITRTKTGSPTGIATVYYEAFR